MATAREVALKALVACHKQGAWADGALKRELKYAGLDSRDGGLASRLCYGVLQQQMYLDFLLSQLSSMPLERVQTEVLDVLRLGAYQLLFTDKIPPMAAVNESVKLAKKVSKNKRSAGFVNGILRNLDRKRDMLEEPKGSISQRLSVGYSHPKWLVEAYAREVGWRETAELLAVHNGAAAMTAQVNTLKTTARELKRKLEEEGVTATAHPWMEDCFVLEHTGNLEGLKSWQDGLFYVQDPAAKLAVLAAKPQPGERVLDLCAAPGGKSFAAAMKMQNTGYLESHDVYPAKVKALRQSALRLGVELKAEVFDARKRMEGGFDLVMADVPCSGLGIIRKKPDIRYKKPENFKELEEIQKEILENAATLVKPGGRLLYATCTLRREENGRQVEEFLRHHGEFTVEKVKLPVDVRGNEEGMVTLWPQRDGTDGFFFTVLRKEAGK